ncbi:DUF4349 domain-containing protein [Nocardioides immobilis]|uniref:DUF4349 domain-containing protein n=1 Tax=Nocardioides immobilis TaxID=2049295 RepID=A0A417Y008_9ACTN|nr:DUF4349 domain-containing protein [Nocardioides immobilis]RHW25980.1 DUF4349 domain-containing protein [Nocardioides immobilis]
MRPAARRRTPVLLSFVAVLLAVLLAAAACSSAGSDDDGGVNPASDAAEREVPADAPAMTEGRDGVAERSIGDNAPLDSADQLSVALDAAGRPDDGATDRKIIAKGNVSLESDDVEAAVVDVQKISDRYFGEITERETTTNDDGDVKTARLLLRIPVADFDKAFLALQEVADLETANTGKEDVTTQVIDTQVRIRAQRRSLARVEALLDRAQSISDIVRIEGQLTRRQADLESLERRLSYLSNQTSMSTISVNISLPPPAKEREKKEEPEEAGFLAGLEDGWKALKSFGTDTATITGKALPFAGVLLVIGAPLFLVLRRLRRGDDDAPAPAAPADA